ncbi:MAG: type I restriction enzyme HsdR N-terminal domain-containing protein [Flavobacteriales bacterium]|nr:type I restriction enzyme HsdR N-terminal domain-containing protein [Flavobacteriales bacterium]MBP9079581.1 type I restriction enzyme HsdR N-terminal domain-containing protein [Flavobacteriales bacterium]
MQALNLPDHGVKTKQGPDGDRIFDPVRRTWVALTPEEWVRQHVLNFLVHDRGCPLSLVAVERKLVLNRMPRRLDILVHDRRGRPLLLVECKAPGVKVDQRTFEQAARYNTVFKVPFLLVTNGLVHYICRVDHGNGLIEFLPALPHYPQLCEALPA